MKIILYGYYNKNNFGDDLFLFIFEKYFINKNIEYIIVNPNILNVTYNTINEQIDAIFIGGGEIINHYFLIPLFRYIKYHKNYNIPIYGASIGCEPNIDIKYINFFDKCIFRNKLNFIDYNISNDIVFSLPLYININNINIKPNTFGFYLISTYKDDEYKILKNITQNILLNYQIRFIVFDNNMDIQIINTLIKDCNITNYEIIISDSYKELLFNILNNEKHLCLRYHAHVICYLYKLQFISVPFTSKTIEFNKLYNITYSYEISNIINLINNQNILFKDIIFDYDILDTFFTNTHISKNKANNIWAVLSEIYDNFIIILNNKSKLLDSQQSYYIEYITYQIELALLKNINTNYKSGIYTKLEIIFNKYNYDTYELQTEFIMILNL